MWAVAYTAFLLPNCITKCYMAQFLHNQAEYYKILNKICGKIGKVMRVSLCASKKSVGPNQNKKYLDLYPKIGAMIKPNVY